MSEFLYSAADAVGTGNRIAPGNPRIELAGQVRSGSLGKFALHLPAKLQFPKWAARLLPGTKFVPGDEPDVVRLKLDRIEFLHERQKRPGS